MADCPWGFSTPSLAAFCEESLCAWIRQPANTWSNIGFFIVGWIILRHAKKYNFEHLNGWAYISLITGLGSTAFHATETMFGGCFDFISLYLGASYMLAVNIRRLTHWEKPKILFVFWLSFFVTTALMLYRDDFARPIYMIEGLLCCIFLEIYLYIKQGKNVRYGWLKAYWVVFGAAFSLWSLDAAKIYCDPQNHWISGHALWHLLDALAIYLVYRFYMQFETLRFDKTITLVEVNELR
jgi:hypothetical protein